MAGTITVERNWSRDIKMRDLYVKVDDLPEQTIQFDEAALFTVESGDHTVTVTNRLYTKALTVTISDGQKVTFQAGNVTGKLMGTAIMVFGVGPYKVDLKRLS